jgi:arylsulfatase A-like enzyme
VARWPGRIPAGVESDALFAHVDMIATFAALTGQRLPAGAGPDAVNVLPALLAEKGAKGRDELVLQNNNQTPLALRSGQWKLISSPGAGSELYNLATDPGEAKNVAASEPARVEAMTARLAAIRGKDLPQPGKAKKKKN